MKTLFGFLLLLLGITLAGCGPYVPVQPENPTVLVVPVAPGPDHIWVQGAWRWNRPARAYAWNDGYWAPRRSHNAWVDGHWAQTRRGWRYVQGHWR